ncbi:MAG: amidohydrolase family protein [Epulopiscium sp.]|nr:amidohydrolase family protein [Candidatus Epulonipiscium sp.]
MIIDIHTHCFDNKIAKKAVQVLEKEANVKAYTDGTISDLKRSMEKSKIDISVIQPIATKPQQTPIINSWIESIMDSKIIPFGTIHPEYDDWQEEINKLASLGVKGIKLHPDYQKFYVDDIKLMKLYEEIIKKDMVILFHAGIDIGLPEPCHCTPKRLKTVLNNMKGGKIIAAHMGGYKLWEEVEEYLLGEDIYFDTSYTSHAMNMDFMERLIRNHGAKKIIFGTDSPWGEQEKEVGFIKRLSITDEEKERIFGINAVKLLKL